MIYSLLNYSRHESSSRTSFSFPLPKPTSPKSPRQQMLQQPGKWSLKNIEEALYLTNGKQYSMKLNKQIVRIMYQQTQALYSINDQYCISLHLPLHHDQNEAIQFTMHKNQIEIQQWQSVDEEIQQTLKRICGSGINKQSCVTGKSLSAQIGHKIGGLFGAVNSMFVKSAQKVQQEQKQIKQNNAIEAKQQSKQETKSKWQIIKDKAKNLNSSASQFMKPATDKLSEYGQTVGQSVSNSGNKVFKSIKDFSVGIKDSLSQGYKNLKTKKQQDKIEDAVQYYQETNKNIQKNAKN